MIRLEERVTAAGLRFVHDRTDRPRLLAGEKSMDAPAMSRSSTLRIARMS